MSNIRRWLQNLFGNLFHALSGRKQLTDEVLQHAEVERAEEELKILQADFVAALNFFKEKYKGHESLPLYLVVGHSNFGKTTLLAKSGMDLHDVYGNKVQNEFSTKYCVWLFSLQAVFLDTAGIYAKSDRAHPHGSLVWLGFLELLQGHFLHNPLSGVIVVIDIPTLMGNRGDLRKALNDIKERLYEIAHYVEKLPIYIVFTKADLIPGFVDFFADLSLEERKQLFGITFAQGISGEYNNPQTSFPSDFSLLLQSLQKRLLPLFHKEEDIQQRDKIQNFLLQFASLRSAIIEVINEIPYGGGHIELYGLYFVSGLQTGETVADPLAVSLQKMLDLPIASESREHTSVVKDGGEENKSYFVEDLFRRELLTNKVEKVKVREISWSQLTVTLVLSLLLGIISFGWYRNYTASVDVLNEAAKMLGDKTQQDYVARLDQTISYLEKKTIAQGSYLGLNQAKKLANLLSESYYKKVATDFTARMQKTLEDEIVTTGATDYKYLYDTLKAYIMLSDTKRMDNNFVQSWFGKYWQKTLATDQAKSQRLARQLKIILQHGVKITPAEQTIATAREILNSRNMSKEDLVYTQLENMYGDKKLIFKFGDKEIHISKLYTSSNFAKVYSKIIPEVVGDFGHSGSDWVVAGSGQAAITQGEMDKLIIGLRTLYVKNYIGIWETAVQQIVIAKFDDIKKMGAFFADIKSNNYQLLAFLKAMQSNLVINNAPVEFTQLVDAKLVGWRDADMPSVEAAVNGLASEFAKIMASQDINKAAFVMAATRFQVADHNSDAIGSLRKVAGRQPKVARDWLQSMADDSWVVVLSGAKSYISAMWVATVVPEYKKLINNNYPFFSTAQSSISLADLAKFFAANGIMDGFFNSYLRSFVDTDQVYWVLKNIDGQHLGLDDDQLEVFIRAALIRKMFYPQGGNIPEVKFSLMGQSLTANTQSFKLTFGDQSFVYAKGQKNVDNLVWPGNNPALLNIGFTDVQGKAVNSVMPQDVWAWFRLLEKANIKAVDKTQRFSFTVDLNGHAVKYEMYAEQPINPFIPEIINNFRCPEKL